MTTQQEYILNNSNVGRDYLRLKDRHAPNIDDFLDYRNAIKRKMVEDTRFPIEWWKMEILAVDEILKICSFDDQ